MAKHKRKAYESEDHGSITPDEDQEEEYCGEGASGRSDVEDVDDEPEYDSIRVRPLTT